MTTNRERIENRVTAVAFTIEGPPCSQPRHRVRGHGRGMYDPAAGAKRDLAFVLRDQMVRQGWERADGSRPLLVTVNALYETPIKKLRGQRKITRPDADNVLKFYMDAMNEIVYEDDKIVCPQAVERLWSDTSVVIIRCWFVG